MAWDASAQDAQSGWDAQAPYIRGDGAIADQGQESEFSNSFARMKIEGGMEGDKRRLRKREYGNFPISLSITLPSPSPSPLVLFVPISTCLTHPCCP